MTILFQWDTSVSNVWNRPNCYPWQKRLISSPLTETFNIFLPLCVVKGNEEYVFSYWLFVTFWSYTYRHFVYVAVMCSIFDYVRFEVSTALTVKSMVFWVVIHVVRRDPDVSEENFASIFSVENIAQFAACFWWLLLSFLFEPEDRSDMFLRNVGPSPNYRTWQPRRL